MEYPEELGIAPLAASLSSRFNLPNFNVGSRFANGIDDLRLFRSEPRPDEWIKFNPKHPTLDWRVPYKGRWYTSNLDFARDWGGSGNIIKELNIKSPIPLSKEIQNYPRHWRSHSWGPEYPAKNILELIRDKKILKDWVPTEGMGSNLGKLDQTHAFRDLYGEVINKPYDKPLKTKFEYFMRNPDDLKKMISLVPPTEIADTGSVNVWESIKKNLWRPNRYGGGIFSGGKESWLKGILGLPDKIKYLNQLRKTGVPMYSGINWQPAANFGLKTLRTIGGVGNVIIGGQALSDIYLGTDHSGNTARDTNRMLNFPTDREGNVIRNINTIKNLRNVAQRDILNPNEMMGVTSFDTTKYDPHIMNAGGIVSLMV